MVIVLKESIFMKEQLVTMINELLEKCNDLDLLDFILKLLQKSN